MNIIVTIDKIDQFNREFRSFCVQMDNQILKRALDQRPRSTHAVVHALQGFIGRGFSTEDMEDVVDLLESGDGDIGQVNQSVLDRIAEIVEARRLVAVYAEIFGAPVVTSGKRPVYDWSAIPMIDTITV